MFERFVTGSHFEFTAPDKVIAECDDFFCGSYTNLRQVRIVLGQMFLGTESSYDKEFKKWFKFIEGFGNFYQDGVNGFGEVSYTLENEYMGKITIKPEYYNKDYDDVWD